MSGSPLPCKKHTTSVLSLVTVSSADANAASPRQARIAAPASPSASTSGSIRSSQVTTFARAPDANTIAPCPIS